MGAGVTPSRRDGVVAVVAAILDVVVFSDVLLPLPPGLHTSAWLVVLWAAIGAGVLLWRRASPLTVVVVLCAHAVIAASLLSYRPVLLVCVALEAVAALGSRRGVLVGLSACTVAVVAWVGAEMRTSPLVVSNAKAAAVGGVYFGLLLGAIGLGIWQRSGARRHREVARRGVEEARLAVLAERRRMARELHDIVGSTVTVMMLQAAGARRIMANDPVRADGALAAVDELGVQAMGELHRLLGILRAAEPSNGEPQQVITDLPGLADADTLLDSLRATGLQVGFTEDGARKRLDPSVDLTCYRVLQEALTNVAKHAGRDARAEVRLTWEERTITITVVDDGRGGNAAKPVGGNGLIGLSERVSIAGGQFAAGRGSSGGFRVSATLPCGRVRD